MSCPVETRFAVTTETGEARLYTKPEVVRSRIYIQVGSIVSFRCVVFLLGAEAIMFVNCIRIRVEFGDCDPAGIVFYANYFRWFDQCTSALFHAAGLPLRQLFKTHGVVGIPLVEARARFIIPSTYGDELVAESCVSEWRKSSFVVSHRFLRDGLLAMEGWETHVWAAAHPAEAHRLKSVPLPREVIRKLSGLKKRPGRKG
jgi:4-hydroxybenzoyl-CoA thioesterase